MSWSTPFPEPIELPDGRKLVTLDQAARYIQKLPKATQQRQEWQTATEILIKAAEGRDLLMHAWIAVMQAVHHGEEAPPRERKRAKVYRIVR